MKGLLRHMGVTPKYFAEFLLAAAFVTIWNSSDGTNDKTVRFQRTEFKEAFIKNAEYGLCGPPEKPNSGVAEATIVDVLRDALKERDGAIDLDGPTVRIIAIRVGKYESTGMIDDAEESNRGLAVPEFDPQLCTMQRCFTSISEDIMR